MRRVDLLWSDEANDFVSSFYYPPACVACGHDEGEHAFAYPNPCCSDTALPWCDCQAFRHADDRTHDEDTYTPNGEEK
jgi:hypothetical protein